MDTDVIETAAPTTVTEGQADEPTTPAPEDLTAEDLTAEDLIEEVSIDGMCGVY